VIQRVRWAQVRVAEEVVGQIGHGLVVLVGVTHDDTVEEARKLASKVWHLRIFDDVDDFDASAPSERGRTMSRPLGDVGGSVMLVSQFTLYGDTSRGRRPSWAAAAPAAQAEPILGALAGALRDLGAPVVAGRFGAHMHVALENDGPVTLLIEV
jgi:D-tyrosyl-tRNA(Tyr) deacylase